MIDFLKWIGTIILGCIAFIIFGLICMCFPQTKFHHTYSSLPLLTYQWNKTTQAHKIVPSYPDSLLHFPETPDTEEV